MQTAVPARCLKAGEKLLAVMTSSGELASLSYDLSEVLAFPQCPASISSMWSPRITIKQEDRDLAQHQSPAYCPNNLTAMYQSRDHAQWRGLRPAESHPQADCDPTKSSEADSLRARLPKTVPVTVVKPATAETIKQQPKPLDGAASLLSPILSCWPCEGINALTICLLCCLNSGPMSLLLGA